MTRDALVTVALALLLGSSADDLRVSLHAAASAYVQNIAKIAPIAGRDTTYDYYERLEEDAALLDDAEVPGGYTRAQWTQTVRTTATLDISLATQLVSGAYVPMASIRGLGETLVRTSSDATLQPVAVYVPASYRSGQPAPLVVFLHGRPQSETQLLAPPFLAQLADQIGAIVIAPWGRGYYDFRQSASDVYDALDAARRAFSIDARKVFLAGYSMGGFSVFEVAPLHPDEWAAVMSISGALLGSDSSRVVAMLPRTPFYVLTGSADASIPTQYPAATAAFLQSSGLPVSFYSQPGGSHRLITLLPVLTRAWSDMRNGIVRTPSTTFARLPLPNAIPMMSLKP